MTSSHPSPPAFATLGRHVAEALPAVVPDRLARQRARFVQGTRQAPPRRAWRALALGLGVVVGAFLVGSFVTRREDAALSVRVDAAPVVAGQWLAAHTTPRTLRFSEGSEVTLAPGAHVRVVALDAQGARILVERGEVTAAVRHADRTRWLFSAGPYTIQVKGTRFDLAWAPEQTRLDLTMREGRVTLRGPRCTEGLVVQGREEVHADVRADTLALGPIAPEDGPVATTVPAPALARPAVEAPLVQPSQRLPVRTTPSRGDRPRQNPTREPPPAERSAQVPTPQSVALVPAVGAPHDDASALWGEASAALRAHEALRARELLLELRRRFSNAPEATQAAFSLGVASFALGAPAVAAGWFERYLRDAPSGALASEARGRRVEALHTAGDSVGAQAAAEDYLRHDPDGAFAPLARSLRRP